MKIFKNEDGTIQTLKFSLTAFILTCILLGGISLPFILKDKAEYTGSGITTTTRNQDAGLLTCNDCDIEFMKKSLNLNYGESIKIKDILDLKDVSLQEVKFNYDSDFIERKTINGDYYFTTSNSVGETTIKASYDKYETSIKVNISTDHIDSAKFSKNTYYVKVGDILDIDIETVPKNADLSLIKLKSNDESIAKFNNTNLTGIVGGKTTITLEYNGVEVTSQVYVMNTPFSVKLKVDGAYTELDEYKIDKISDGEIYYVAINIDDPTKTQDNVSVSEESSGSIATKTSFDEVWSIDNKSLIYKIVFTYNPTSSGETNESIITFRLDDGSERVLKIYK